MARKTKITMKLEGAPGSGKSIILRKLRLYLEFFDIEATIDDVEHTLDLRFNQDALHRLRDAR